MLRKLMKYELKATGRVMLPLYLAVVALAAVLRGLAVWSQALHYDAVTGFDPVRVLLTLVTAAFFLALVAVPIAAVVLMIIRFKTNLLSDEGYVMFTLPVSSHKLVWSKLLTSAVWFIGAALADCLGVLILAAEEGFLSGLWQGLRDLFAEMTAYYAANGVLVIVELVILVLVVCFTTCLEFYCPMAIGHSFARHKVLLSVVFFFVIGAVRQAAGVALISAGVPFLGDMEALLSGLSPAAAIHGGIWVITLTTAVCGAILYAITMRMLNRHLNLE